MKKVRLSEMTIAYRENDKPGHPVLYIHGNSSSSKTFEKQLQVSNHRCIALDLPGHGDSDHFASHTDYGIPAYAKTVAELVQVLDIEDAIIVGWSLGGHVALEAVKLLPKSKGFVIFGTPPLAFPPAMEDAFMPNPAVNVGFIPDVTDEQAVLYANAFFKEGVKAPQSPFIDDILRTDGNARAGLGASIKPDGFEDEVKIVANMKKPLAVLHGEQEALINPAYLKSLEMPSLWRGEIQFIPDAAHAAHWENPTVFNALIEAFVNEVNT